jgi:hypothetical protein
LSSAADAILSASLLDPGDDFVEVVQLMLGDLKSIRPIVPATLASRRR